ncbi:hypothetical protein ACI2OX_07025 [Bacillus sp. N9]
MLYSLPLFIAAFIVWSIGYEMFMGKNIFIITGLIIIQTTLSILFIRRRFTSIRTFEQDIAIDELEKRN